MRFLFTVMIFFLTIALFPQNKPSLSDAAYQSLHDKVKLQISNNLDSVYYYCSEIEKSNNNLHKVFAKGYKSYYYQLKGDTVSSNRNLDLATSILQREKASAGKYESEMQLLNLWGLIYRKRGKYNDAIHKFNEGKSIANKTNDQKQLIKYNNNIASINADIGNVDIAIGALRENDKRIDNIKYLYSEAEYFKSKSIINYNLGNYYQDLFVKKNRTGYLDTAAYYYNKTILYSNDLAYNKVRASIDLASIRFFKKDFEGAEKYYNTAYVFSTENELYTEQMIIMYNLGHLNYFLGKYERALVCFRAVDAISHAHNIKGYEFIMSNFYQARIHYLFEDHEKVLFHLDIYSNEYDRVAKNIINESIKINHEISSAAIQKEVALLQQDTEKKRMLSYLWKSGLLLTVLGLVFYLVKISIEKRKANKKVEELLQEYKNISKSNDRMGLAQPVTIDNETEKGIIEKLKILIDKKYFLSQEFNLQNVAKKIKTNTTYLSHVINKNFEKSFSEYSNELKINYAIEQLINNPTYRKYSTQAIAESVGFKNNVSFAKSFKKRAGVSPAQFILKIEKY